MFSSAIVWEIPVLVYDVELVVDERCFIMARCLAASPVILRVLVLNVSKIASFEFFLPIIQIPSYKISIKYDII